MTPKSSTVRMSSLHTLEESILREFEEKWYSHVKHNKKIFSHQKKFISTALHRQREAIREMVEKFTEHPIQCIRYKSSAGRPTEDGGYEQKFGDKWYRKIPVDETPKCDCGLHDILSLLTSKEK